MEAVGNSGENLDAESHRVGQIPVVPLTSCVTVGKLLNLFDLGFPVYKMGLLIVTS